jgi:hypothetical protein
VRVRAVLRVYPHARRLENVARLVPLPLAVAALLGVVTLQPLVLAGVAGLTVGYLAAFLWASRRVPGSLSSRLRGALLFTFGNLGFGVGYLRESLKRKEAERIREPSRSY